LAATNQTVMRRIGGPSVAKRALTLLIVFLAVTVITLVSSTVATAQHDTMNYLMLFQNIPKAAAFLALRMENEVCQRQLLKYKDEIEVLQKAEKLEKPTESMVRETLCAMDEECVDAIGGLFKLLFAKGGTVTEGVARQYFGGKGVDLQQIDKLMMQYVKSKLCLDGFGRKTYASAQEL